ncbi:hypothetical protein EXU57_05440 [Segetibacter sp. 3557_3]|uniref:hypothetical protein n=1 Tax=Segetibacter sp. 3557_3 TaxID=2547429 RepID=UPI0010590384|nr:hypothetical protein [Segetibacter sp. 3557_3]TDH27910.1 hypothetical protein EXU57_05440 [Segetibacter sp. 3557_3]
MERVGILINKLQEQILQKADVRSMLVTTQMLQAELMQHVKKQNGHSLSRVSVVLPFNSSAIGQQVNVAETLQTGSRHKPEVKESPAQVVEPARKPHVEVIEPRHNPEVKHDDKFVEEVSSQPVSEPDITLATTEVKPVEHAGRFQGKSSTGWLFHPGEVPTLAHQEKAGAEVNDTLVKDGGSLNEALKQEKAEVAHTLQGTPIKDLKKAISINDRHRFIHDLFRDDETMYERSIKTINSFHIFPEAEYWIQRELKLKLGWDINNETVKTFDQLVKRRFS